MSSGYKFIKLRSAASINISPIGTFFSCFLILLLLLSGCGGGGGGASNVANKDVALADLNFPIESIALVSPTESGSINLVTGYPQKLLVAGIDKNGTRKLLSAKDGLAFKIKESDYVKVSESGIIEGKVSGEAFLTVSLNDKIFLNNIPVKVDASILKSITIYADNNSESSILLPESFHVKLRALGVFNNNNSNVTRDISAYTGLWSSTNSTISFESNTIFGTTLFSNKASEEKALITSKLGNVESSILVKVVNARLSNISLLPNGSVVPFNSKTQMDAVGTFSFENATFNRDMTNNVVWSVESSIATIDDTTGLLTSYDTRGKVVVRALPLLGESAIAKITIDNPVIESVYISAKSGGFPIPSESEVIIANGLTTNVYTYAVYSNGETHPLNLKFESGCTWLNGTGPGQVSVASQGEFSTVTGKKQGDTSFTLSCINSQNNTIQSTTKVFVESGALLSIDIDTKTPILPKGNSTSLTITAHYSDGINNTLSPKNVIWSSAPSGIISINPDTGLAMAESVGKTTVKAEYRGVGGETIAPAYKDFEVVSAVLKSISIELESNIIVSGTTQKIAAIGHLTDGSQLDYSSLVDWHCQSPIQCSDNIMKAESVYNQSPTVAISATDPNTGIVSETKNVTDIPLVISEIIFGHSIYDTCSAYESSPSIKVMCLMSVSFKYNSGEIKQYYKTDNYKSVQFSWNPKPTRESYPANDNPYFMFYYTLNKKESFHSTMTVKTPIAAGSKSYIESSVIMPYKPMSFSY